VIHRANCKWQVDLGGVCGWGWGGGGGGGGI